jgi:hypothetical protein
MNGSTNIYADGFFRQKKKSSSLMGLASESEEYGLNENGVIHLENIEIAVGQATRLAQSCHWTSE